MRLLQARRSVGIYDSRLDNKPVAAVGGRENTLSFKGSAPGVWCPAMAASVAGLTGGLASVSHGGRSQQSSSTQTAVTQGVHLSARGQSNCVKCVCPILAFGQPIRRRCSLGSRTIERQWRVFANSGTASSEWNAVQSPYETLGTWNAFTCFKTAGAWANAVNGYILGEAAKFMVYLDL